MSERAIREAANHGPGCWVGLHNCVCGLDKALEDEPDVVKVLRWLKVWANEAELQGKGKTALELDIIVAQLQVTFHVRLTDDDGWEWTE